LALLVGYKYEYLLRVSNNPEKFYRTFTIPKKSGGERDISEPLPSLKEIQRWILDEILNRYPISRYAKAYVRKRSIRENARFHVNKKLVLTIDVMDFFPSLRYNKVYGLFVGLGYSVPVATMLSNLCCLNGGLPQGAPTSPALSNILMINVDKRISGFIKKKEIRYTRYADDMNFSGDFEPGMVIKYIRDVLRDANLQINEKKIRIRTPGQRQEVTGVIVNEKIQAPKEMRRKLRQSVYYIEKFGLASHLDKTENTRANHIYHLLGIANFILFLNPEDQEARGYIETLRKYLPRKD
jgi:RNA-directed DNA polymerase